MSTLDAPEARFHDPVLRDLSAVPASTAFVEAVTALAAEPPRLEVLEAQLARW